MNLCIAGFLATSVDGFIARKDGSLDWLDRANITQLPCFAGAQVYPFGYIQSTFGVVY